MTTSSILFLDIETFPHLAHVWKLYEDNALDVVKESIICGFSAKWLGGDHITRVLPDYPRYSAGSENDIRLVKELWSLVDKADIVVAHNARKFDIKRMNARFAKHGMLPPSPYSVVDTLQVSTRVFGFGANRLDYLCEYLGLGRKANTGGFSLWMDCMAGDKAAWDKMRKYNEHDVVLLEKLYLRLLPWMNTHPNLALHKDRDACPKCGSIKITARGVRHAATRSYQRYACEDCGGWSQSTKLLRSVTIRNA